MDMSLNNLQDVFEEQLKDIYSAEKQLTEALPKIVKAASSPELKQAIQHHYEVTQYQLERVQNILQSMDINPGNKVCKAMQGLIEEGDEMAKQQGDSDARDAGLIAAAQKVEHYEIASYGTVRSLAQQLNDSYSAELLEETLEEEKDTDHLLTTIAEGSVNPASA
jgi:ferritin-like metal-binding protein YciE